MKKQFLRRTLAMLLSLVLLLGFGVLPVSAAKEEGVVIKLHYNRPDGVYDDWSVWFWNLGEEGVDIPFEKVDGEMVATYKVKPGVTSVGFIVKLPNWAAKDVNEDQFIDVAAFVSGTIHVYVEAGVKGYAATLDDDVVSGVKVSAVRYKETEGGQVAMTAGVDPNAFTLWGPDGEIAPVVVLDGGNLIYTLVLAEPLDPYGSYTLRFMGQDYAVKMPNGYSTESFEKEYTYTGNDLGANWTAEKTTFRVWAPTAASVKVNLYTSGTAGTDDLI